MSSEPIAEVGTIMWRDLTIQDAESIRDFYASVVGWKASPQSMGDYDDYNIQLPESGTIVAGICHARGSNANVPPAWLIYIIVSDVNASANRCVELGGSVVDGPRLMGDHLFCVIRDPAGAVVALYSQRPVPE